jgi:hypothetical protein
MGSVDENQQRLQHPYIENHFPRSGLSILPIGSSESSYFSQNQHQLHRNDSNNSRQSLKENFMRINEEEEEEKESSMPLSSMISPKRPFMEKSNSNDSDFSAGFDNTNHQLPYDSSSSSDNSTVVNSRHPSLKVNSNTGIGNENNNNINNNNGISPSISNFPSEDFDESHYFQNHSLSVSNMNLNDSDLIIPNIPSFDPNDNLPSSSSLLQNPLSTGIETNHKKDSSVEITPDNSLLLSNLLPPPPPETFSREENDEKNNDSDATVDNNINQLDEDGRKRLESDASNLGTIDPVDSTDPMSFGNIDIGIHEYSTILYRFIDLACIHSEILQLQVCSFRTLFCFF